MPLRDHFRPPLADQRSWEGFHGGWPMMIVSALGRRLPSRYIAEPQVHLGPSIEIDVATFEGDDPEYALSLGGGNGGGGVATAVWAPPEPTLVLDGGLPEVDDYEVRVFDTRRGRRLVAAVEIVSRSNKDRPEHRRAFVAKCASLLQEGVCVTIVDLVTTRSTNLYADLLDFLGQVDPSLAEGAPPLYAATCRWVRRGKVRSLEAWSHALSLARPLPTLPLWLAENLAVPLELDASYEETCRVLRIA